MQPGLNYEEMGVSVMSPEYFMTNTQGILECLETVKGRASEGLLLGIGDYNIGNPKCLVTPAGNGMLGAIASFLGRPYCSAVNDNGSVTRTEVEELGLECLLLSQLMKKDPEVVRYLSGVWDGSFSPESYRAVLDEDDRVRAFMIPPGQFFSMFNEMVTVISTLN